MCWIALLRRLRIAQSEIETVFHKAAVQRVQGGQGSGLSRVSATPVVVCMRILRRSWDFMVWIPEQYVIAALFNEHTKPDEVVRPLCMSTIFDIAVIV